MDIPNLRWWGWGTLDEGYPLDARADLLPALQRALGLPDEALECETPPIAIEAIALRPSRLDGPMLASLRRLVGETAVRVDARARIEHAYGKSYRDLVRIRAGYVPDPPDAVVYPADQGQVVAILAWAAEREVAVVPFGGGSSLSAGVEPTPGDHLTVTLDLARLSQVLFVDTAARRVRAQAGITGPRLEAALAAHGFTAGHFPQSFEFSTLGGWVATRGVGYLSTGYGAIEGMTCALRLVTPVGIVETRDGSASATAGASLLHLVLGSAGVYGVITEAELTIHPRPAVQDARGILFDDLESGIVACRTVVQSPELRPALVQLSDAGEAAAYALASDRRHGLHRLSDVLQSGSRRVGGPDLDNAAVLLLSFEGDSKVVARQWSMASQICADYRGVSLGRAVAQEWARERTLQPYLRDVLIGHGVLVDQLETAASWADLPRLHEAVVSALKGAVSASGGGPGYVMVHVAHVSERGATLYATFLGRQVADPDPMVKAAQAQMVKQATVDAVLAAGGTLMRTPGFGPNGRTLWPADELSPLGFRALRAVKETLDPFGIMNPIHLLAA
jgi:alkyldihydroxyacetonephosphate synthase